MKHKESIWQNVLHFAVLCAGHIYCYIPAGYYILYLLETFERGYYRLLLPYCLMISAWKIISICSVSAIFPQYLLNSLLVASLTAVFTLMISALAAYALVWLKFPGKLLVEKAVLAVYMVLRPFY